MDQTCFSKISFFNSKNAFIYLEGNWKADQQHSISNRKSSKDVLYLPTTSSNLIHSCIYVSVHTCTQTRVPSSFVRASEQTYSAQILSPFPPLLWQRFLADYATESPRVSAVCISELLKQSCKAQTNPWHPLAIPQDGPALTGPCCPVPGATPITTDVFISGTDGLQVSIFSWPS